MHTSTRGKLFITTHFDCATVDPVTQLPLPYKYHIGGIVEVVEAGETIVYNLMSGQYRVADVTGNLTDTQLKKLKDLYEPTDSEMIAIVVNDTLKEFENIEQCYGVATFDSNIITPWLNHRKALQCWGVRGELAIARIEQVLFPMIAEQVKNGYSACNEQDWLDLLADDSLNAALLLAKATMALKYLDEAKAELEEYTSNKKLADSKLKLTKARGESNEVVAEFTLNNIAEFEKEISRWEQNIKETQEKVAEAEKLAAKSTSTISEVNDLLQKAVDAAQIAKLN